MKIAFFPFFAFFLLSIQCCTLSPCFAYSLLVQPSTGGDGTTGNYEIDGIGNANGAPTISWNDYQQFNDNYGVPVSGVSGNCYNAASFSGTWLSGHSGSVYTATNSYNFGVPPQQTMGKGTITRHVRIPTTDAGGGGDYYFTSVPAGFVEGISICMVSQPELVNGVADGKFVPLVGATVTMYQCPDSNNVHFGSFDGSPWGINYKTVLRGGLTYAIFGTAEGSSLPPDAAYPSGPAQQSYTFKASCTGYQPVSAAIRLGNTWPGYSVSIILQPVGSSTPSSVTAPSTADPTAGVAASVAGAAAGSGGTGSSGSGLGFPSDFFTQLQNSMITLFTPKQADIDSLHAAINQLFTWGPFETVHEIIQIWQFETTLGAFAKTSADPTYWYFPLGISAITSTPAASNQGRTGIYPTGFDPANQNVQLPSVQKYNNALAWSHELGRGSGPYMVARSQDGALRPGAVSRASVAGDGGSTLNINLWEHLIPSYWDMSPYASGIIVFRWILWASGWTAFIITLRNKFTPSFKI